MLEFCCYGLSILFIYSFITISYVIPLFLLVVESFFWIPGRAYPLFVVL